MEKKKILFICTGNVCRSQMAEGLVNHLLGDQFEAYSAGLLPSKVSNRAAAVMAEIGIDISTQRSKHIEELENLEYDQIITLCSDADKRCRVYLGEKGETKRVHIGFPDPMRAAGTDEKVLEQFRSVRDQIRDKVISHLQKGLSNLNE